MLKDIRRMRGESWGCGRGIAHSSPSFPRTLQFFRRAANRISVWKGDRETSHFRHLIIRRRTILNWEITKNLESNRALTFEVLVERRFATVKIWSVIRDSIRSKLCRVTDQMRRMKCRSYTSEHFALRTIYIYIYILSCLYNSKNFETNFARTAEKRALIL